MNIRSEIRAVVFPLVEDRSEYEEWLKSRNLKTTFSKRGPIERGNELVYIQQSLPEGQQEYEEIIGGVKHLTYGKKASYKTKRQPKQKKEEPTQV